MNNNNKKLITNVILVSVVVGILHILPVNYYQYVSFIYSWGGNDICGVLFIAGICSITTSFLINLILGILFKDKARDCFKNILRYTLLASLIFGCASAVDISIFEYSRDLEYKQTHAAEIADEKLNLQKYKEVSKILKANRIYGEHYSIGPSASNGLEIHKVFYNFNELKRLESSNFVLINNTENKYSKYIVLVDIPNKKILQVINTEDLIKEVRSEVGSESENIGITDSLGSELLFGWGDYIQSNDYKEFYKFNFTVDSVNKRIKIDRKRWTDADYKKQQEEKNRIEGIMGKF